MKYILFISTLLILFGCKKTETFTVHGNVKDIFTNQNVSGIYIVIYPFDRKTAPGTTVSKPLAETYSDENGNYNIIIDYKYKKDPINGLLICVEYPNGFDSTKNAYKYFYYPPLEVERSEFLNSQDLIGTPMGDINFYTTNTIWDSIQADSILVNSPYQSEYLIRNVSLQNQIGFNVQPSVESTFSWCYIKNGIQSALITKSIFVPLYYCSQYGIYKPPLSYKLEF